MNEMKKLLYILMMIGATTLMSVACRENTDDEVRPVKLNVELTLPVSTEVTTRAAGDPGLAEFFERPRYLSLFLAVGDPTTPTENPVYYYNIPCAQTDWERSSDSLIFRGRFSHLVNWDIDPRVALRSDLAVRAYMVASFDAYVTDPIIQVDNWNKVTNTGFNEAQLIDMQFYASSTTQGYAGFSLRDIYSTPYNLSDDLYQPITAEDRTGYYATVRSIVGEGDASVISINDTLYHTAAKVDFRWNTSTPTQENVMVSAVIGNAPTKGYLFRPAETVTGVATYSKVLLRGGSVTADDQNQQHEARYADAEEVSAGSQWSGRAYTYILQPGALQYILTTSQGGTTTGTATPPSDNTTTNRIFAAWYLLPFNIKATE